MKWGIWSLQSKAWVYDTTPDEPVEHDTRGAAKADLKDWCLKEFGKHYEVRKRP